MAKAAMFYCLLGPSFHMVPQILFYNLSVLDAFLHCIGLAVLQLALQTRIALNSGFKSVHYHACP